MKAYLANPGVDAELERVSLPDVGLFLVDEEAVPATAAALAEADLAVRGEAAALRGRCREEETEEEEEGSEGERVAKEGATELRRRTKEGAGLAWRKERKKT